jgi:hypothetical protein
LTDIAEITRPGRRHRQPSRGRDVDPDVMRAAAVLPGTALILTCGDHCNRAAAIGLLLGIPIAVAIIASRGPQRHDKEIVYRAP